MFEVLTIEPWQNGGGSLSYPGQLKIGEGKWVQNTTDRVTLSNETLIEILGGKFLSLFHFSDSKYKYYNVDRNS